MIFHCIIYDENFSLNVKGYKEEDDLDDAVQLFGIFDSDGDKNIDLQEFITAFNDNNRIIHLNQFYGY
jgi:hypothetical protein